MQGHGKPNIMEFTIKTNEDKPENITHPDKAMESLLQHASGVGKEASRCLSQSRRIQQIVTRLQKKAKGYHCQQGNDAPTKLDMEKVHDRLNGQTANAIIKNADHSCMIEAGLVKFLSIHDYNDTRHIASLKRYINTYNNADNEASKNKIHYRREISRRTLHDQKEGPAAVKLSGR